jgi:imidazole glycerol phosphate synthase subunit HisF
MTRTFYFAGEFALAPRTATGLATGFDFAGFADEAFELVNIFVIKAGGSPFTPPSATAFTTATASATATTSATSTAPSAFFFVHIIIITHDVVFSLLVFVWIVV